MLIVPQVLMSMAEVPADSLCTIHNTRHVTYVKNILADADEHGAAALPAGGQHRRRQPVRLSGAIPGNAVCSNLGNSPHSAPDNLRDEMP